MINPSFALGQLLLLPIKIIAWHGGQSNRPSKKIVSSLASAPDRGKEDILLLPLCLLDSARFAARRRDRGRSRLFLCLVKGN